jgi:hypothetical protein
VPGQTRPVPLIISIHDPKVSSLAVQVTYGPTRTNERRENLVISQDIAHRSKFDPHKVTHLHHSGIVSYAIYRIPSNNARCPTGLRSRLPIFLQLHGAGVEADSHLVSHAMDDIPNLCAWVIMPSGVTSWSGDDWRKSPFDLTEQCDSSY